MYPSLSTALPPVAEASQALSSEGGVHPEFTHQVFGDAERIYGYEGLKIQVLVK